MSKIDEIGKNKYNSIHTILKKENPKKGVCQFCDSVRHTEWALKRGREYTIDIDDYFELCISCHRKYDITDETREKMSKSHLGEIKIWNRKQYHCDYDNCDNPHRAKGLCIYHYNKKFYPWKTKKNKS